MDSPLVYLLRMFVNKVNEYKLKNISSLILCVSSNSTIFYFGTVTLEHILSFGYQFSVIAFMRSATAVYGSE